MRGLDQIIRSNEELAKLRPQPGRQPWPFPEAVTPPVEPVQLPKVNVDPADPAA